MVVKLGFFLFLGSEGFGGGGGLGGALLEFVHAAGGIHKLLLAGVKRMAGVANTDDDGRLGGTRLDDVAAGATDLGVHIFRMNVRLHKIGRSNYHSPAKRQAGIWIDPLPLRVNGDIFRGNDEVL